MKWWLQSFLVDTKKLLIGMRDDSGIVHKLINFEVSQVRLYLLFYELICLILIFLDSKSSKSKSFFGNVNNSVK
jgi:hypothetical protein